MPVGLIRAVCKDKSNLKCMNVRSSVNAGHAEAGLLPVCSNVVQLLGFRKSLLKVALASRNG